MTHTADLSHCHHGCMQGWAQFGGLLLIWLAENDHGGADMYMQTIAAATAWIQHRDKQMYEMRYAKMMRKEPGQTDRRVQNSACLCKPKQHLPKAAAACVHRQLMCLVFPHLLVAHNVTRGFCQAVQVSIAARIALQHQRGVLIEGLPELCELLAHLENAKPRL